MAQLPSSERLYTAKEISEQMGVDAQSVRHSIRKLFPEKTSNGKTTYLNEVEVTKISIDMKKAHNSNLSSTSQVPTTDLEQMIKLHESLQWASNKISELSEKAAGYDLLIETHNTISIGEYAKSVDIGRNTMFLKLRKSGILDGYNMPYQQYMHHFEVRQIERNGRVCPTTFIKASGIDYCNKKLGIKR